MIYLSLSTALMRNNLFTRATSAQVGVWYRLCCYCAEQENGGIIGGCRDWDAIMWARAIGIAPEEVAGDCTLWKWSAVNALIVHEYPMELERKVQQNRQSGKIGGNRRSETKASAVRENGKKGGRPRKIVPLRYEAGSE
jgi:hypothetical protein